MKNISNPDLPIAPATRREFMTRLAAGAVAVAGTAPVELFAQAAPAAPKPPADPAGTLSNAAVMSDKSAAMKIGRAHV